MNSIRKTTLILAAALLTWSAVGAPSQQQLADEAYERAMKVYEVDEQASITLFNKAARLGHVDAMVRLGYIFQTSPNPTYKNALMWYKKAVEAGNTAAIYEVGSIYEKGGRVIQPDIAEAIHWYETGVSNNSLKSCEALARIYASSGNPGFHNGDKAIHYATLLVKKDSNNPDYMDLLAAAYARNHEFPKALKAANEAITLSPLEEAADRRARKAVYEADKPWPETASDEWILTAAEAENLWAMLKLAQRYGDEIGPDYNPVNARLWYERAAENGSMEALLKLGHLCFHGEGGDVDMKKAYWCFSEAAQAEIEAAYIPLARMYVGGKGTKIDFDEALLWYQRANEIDKRYGGMEIGALRSHLRNPGQPSAEELYEQAKSIAENNLPGPDGTVPVPGKKTILFLTRYWLAAEQGHTGAMKEMADLYFYGKRYLKRDAAPEDKNAGGIGINYAKALDWYEQLARKGIESPELDECRALYLQQLKEKRDREIRKRDAKFAAAKVKAKKG